MGKLGTPRTGRSTPDLQAEGERVQAEVVGTQVMITPVFLRHALP